MGRLYQLTWQSPRLLIWDAANFNLVKETVTPLTDGWGICTNGASLIVSDSSPTLVWLDPATLQRQRSVDVHDDGRPVPWINEVRAAGRRVRSPNAQGAHGLQTEQNLWHR